MMSKRDLALITIDSIATACTQKHADNTAWLSRFTQGADLVRANKVRYVPEPGYYLVKSSDGEREYAVGTDARSCECADHPPEGLRCKHRYAVDIYKKALVRLHRIYEEGKVHQHAFICQHGKGLECWDAHCQEPQDTYCPACLAQQQEATGGLLRRAEEDGEPAALPNDAPGEEAGTPEDAQHPYAARLAEQQYEPAPILPMHPLAPWPPATLPEAPASLNLKLHLPGGHEAMYTMRSMRPGAAGDLELLERLPELLQELQMRLDVAFPKSTRSNGYDGK